MYQLAGKTMQNKLFLPLVSILNLFYVMFLRRDVIFVVVVYLIEWINLRMWPPLESMNTLGRREFFLFGHVYARFFYIPSTVASTECISTPFYEYFTPHTMFLHANIGRLHIQYYFGYKTFINCVNDNVTWWNTHSDIKPIVLIAGRIRLFSPSTAQKKKKKS